MAEHESVVRMHHIFPRSSVCGHVGCFHGWATADIAAVNIGGVKPFELVFCFLRAKWVEGNRRQASSHGVNESQHGEYSQGCCTSVWEQVADTLGVSAA